jgi:hypothetical protein
VQAIFPAAFPGIRTTQKPDRDIAEVTKLAGYHEIGGRDEANLPQEFSNRFSDRHVPLHFSAPRPPDLSGTLW